MLRLACITACLLAGLLPAACASSIGAISDSTEETYWLAGLDEYTELNGGALAANQAGFAAVLMSSRNLDTGLYYRVTYEQDGTQLATGPARFPRDTSANYWTWDYYAHLSETDGNLLVNGDTCSLTLTLPDPPAGYTDVQLTGTFNRQEAQRALDKLRKSKSAGGIEKGTVRFVITWQASFEQDGEPVSLGFTQEFRAARIRYDTPI